MLHQQIAIYFNNKYIEQATIMGAIELDTIPRASLVSAPTKALIGQTIPITITKTNSSYNHMLTYTYNGVDYLITGRTGTDVTVYNWTIPDSLYQLMKVAADYVTINCTTISNLSEVGTTTVRIIVGVDEKICSPIVSIDYSDTDDNTTRVTGDTNKFVLYKSNIAYTITATARKYATIKSYNIVCGTQTFTEESGTIFNVDSDFLTVTVTDNRDITTTKEIDLSGVMVKYVPVTCTASISAPTTDGVATVTLKGKYYNGSFGAVNNALKLYYRYTDSDGGAVENTLVASDIDISNNSYSSTFDISGLDYLKTYNFIFTAIDELSAKETESISIRTKPVFDWSATDFNFNVPVTIQGKSIAATDSYIVEQGTAAMGSNGTWYWRKWSDGTADCYGVRNYGNTAVTITWGGLYRSQSFTQAFPEGLFIDAPDVTNISIASGNFGGWVAFYETTAATSAASSSFIILRPASATISQMHLSFYVIGRW